MLRQLFTFFEKFCIITILYHLVGVESSTNSICDFSKCKCTRKAAEWKILNCTLDFAQDMYLEPNRVPATIIEIYFNGGRHIILSPKSIENLPLTLLHFNGTKKIVMKKKSIYNVVSPSLLLQTYNCDHLKVESDAFDNNTNCAIKVEFQKCGTVTLEKSAFSNLNSFLSQSISTLSLAPGTFTFKNKQHIGKHGPITTISFNNVTIPRISQNTFFSSLAEININNSEIYEIDSGAINAIQISSIYISNSVIHSFKKNSFSDKTMAFSLTLDRCSIKVLETHCIAGGIGNFTLQHCRIMDIEQNAINGTILNIAITGNTINTLNHNSFVFNNWNEIKIQQNVINDLKSGFLAVAPSANVKTIHFDDNEIYHIQSAAFSFFKHINIERITFKGNFFNQSCHCHMHDWGVDLISINNTEKVDHLLSNTFCRLNQLLSNCFNLSTDIININNFTKLVCHTQNTIICKSYVGKIKVLQSTTNLSLADQLTNTLRWWLLSIFIVILLSAFILITVKVLVRRRQWLKTKPKDYYDTKPQQEEDLDNNDEDQNTLVTLDGTELEEEHQNDVPDEVTMEFLKELSIKLDNPNTHQEAAQIIERLYEMFIVDDTYENRYDLRGEDGIHLYEDLNNINTLHDKPEIHTKNVLRYMERKINTLQSVKNDNPLVLPHILDYSEPSDAEQHVYSELKRPENF